jgi:hypothetical protein
LARFSTPIGDVDLPGALGNGYDKIEDVRQRGRATVIWEMSAESCVSIGAIMHDPAFGWFNSGTDDGVIVDELGGSQLLPAVGMQPAWARIAVVEFTADAACDPADFQLLPAGTESSAFGRGVIEPANIDYAGCSATIGCPCIYDLDGSCTIAAGDLGIFAACWGCCEGDDCWLTGDCALKNRRTRWMKSRIS